MRGQRCVGLAWRRTQPFSPLESTNSPFINVICKFLNDGFGGTHSTKQKKSNLFAALKVYSGPILTLHLSTMGTATHNFKSKTNSVSRYRIRWQMIPSKLDVGKFSVFTLPRLCQNTWLADLAREWKIKPPFTVLKPSTTLIMNKKFYCFKGVCVVSLIFQKKKKKKTKKTPEARNLNICTTHEDVYLPSIAHRWVYWPFISVIKIHIFLMTSLCSV